MCVTVAVCFLTNPADKGDILTLPVMQPALEDIREGYSVEQAAADGCVVFDEDELLAGREIWRNFVDVTGEGKADGIRVYQTYTNADESYYVVQELSFDGEKYRLKFYDIVGDTGEEFLFEKEYRYLVYSRCISQYGNSDNYLLSDSRDVTANGYYEHLLSSTYSPESKYNACFMIYSESRE